MKKIFLLSALLFGSVYSTTTVTAQGHQKNDCVNPCMNQVRACVGRAGNGINLDFNVVESGGSFYIEVTTNGGGANQNVVAQCITENQNCGGSGWCRSMPTLVRAF